MYLSASSLILLLSRVLSCTPLLAQQEFLTGILFLIPIPLHSSKKTVTSLKSLQCKMVGSYVRMLVVEPLAGNSALQTPFQNTSFAMLKFSDIFDMGASNRESSRLSHSRLASWESFLRQAPRKVSWETLEWSQVTAQPGNIAHLQRNGHIQVKQQNFRTIITVRVQFVHEKNIEMSLDNLHPGFYLLRLAVPCRSLWWCSQPLLVDLYVLC